jgi:hypothetical protein
MNVDVLLTCSGDSSVQPCSMPHMLVGYSEKAVLTFHIPHNFFTDSRKPLKGFGQK